MPALVAAESTAIDNQSKLRVLRHIWQLLAHMPTKGCLGNGILTHLCSYAAAKLTSTLTWADQSKVGSVSHQILGEHGVPGEYHGVFRRAEAVHRAIVAIKGVVGRAVRRIRA